MALVELPSDCLWLIFDHLGLRNQPGSPTTLNKRWAQVVQAYFQANVQFNTADGVNLATVLPYRDVLVQGSLRCPSWTIQPFLRRLTVEARDVHPRPAYDFSGWPCLSYLETTHLDITGLPLRLTILRVDEIKVEIVKSAQELKLLSIKRLQGDISGLTSLNSLSTLRVSHFTGEPVGISRLAQLNELSLGGHQINLSDPVIEEIATLTQLTRVDYANLTLTPLTRLTNLPVLCLREPSLTPTSGYNLISQWSELSFLILTSESRYVNPDCLAPLASLQNLRYLMISHLFCDSDTTPILTQITRLSLDAKRLDHHFLWKFPNLTWLELTYAPSQRVYFNSILQLGQLKELIINLKSSHDVERLHQEGVWQLIQGTMKITVRHLGNTI